MDFMGSPFSPTSGSSTHTSNPFAGPLPPVAANIRDVPIANHVPVKLSHTATNFYAWKTYFNLLFCEYNLRDHLNGSIDFFVMRADTEWMAIDATIIRWFFLTVSDDIFRTVMRDGDSAYTVWTKITSLFTDNRLQRIVFLQQEFFDLHQNDSSIDEYCMCLKTLSDELCDLPFPVSDELLLSTLTAGLNEDPGNAASNLTLPATPTFQKAIAYLRLEERRIKNQRTRAIHTALAAGISCGASSPSAPPQPRHPAPSAHPPPQPPAATDRNRQRKRGAAMASPAPTPSGRPARRNSSNRPRHGVAGTTCGPALSTHTPCPCRARRALAS